MIEKMEKVLYTAKVKTTGGREGGSSRSSDGRLEIKLSTPGGPGTGTNPEQLFAAGWSACYLSALKIVAAHMKVRMPENAAIEPEIDLGTNENGYLIQARLNVYLPGIERSVAEQMIEMAHQTCPYSKATHGNVSVVTTLLEAAPASNVA